jgi:hypothetical protein
MTDPKISLKLVSAPAKGIALKAPPVLKASDSPWIILAANAARFCCMPRRTKFTAS